MRRVLSSLKVMPNFGSSAQEVGAFELRWNNKSENTCNCGNVAELHNYLVAMVRTLGSCQEERKNTWRGSH